MPDLLTLIEPPTVIKPPSPRARGEIEGCVSWLLASEELDCASILSNLAMDIADLYRMNPTLGEECTGMVAGTYYCYSTGDDEVSEPPTITDVSHLFNNKNYLMLTITELPASYSPFKQYY